MARKFVNVEMLIMRHSNDERIIFVDKTKKKEVEYVVYKLDGESTVDVLRKMYNDDFQKRIEEYGG